MNIESIFREYILSKLVFLFCILFISISLTSTSNADIAGLTGNANRNLIQDGQAATVNVTWNMTVVGFSGGGNGTVFSTNGTFSSQGGVVGVNNKRIERSFNFPDLVNTPVTFTETIQIPQSLLYTVRKQGSAVFTYARTFSDTTPTTQVPGTAVVMFQITNSANGRLSFSRVDLRFDNDETVRVVPVGTQLSALANINYNGAGLFDFDWEIATPASTQGTPFFSTLYTQRKYLGAGREAYIQSPNLPTDETGVYFIRLNIRSPETGFEPVQIRYVVIDSNIGPDPIKLEKIRLSSPLPKAVLQEETTFNWESVDGTRAYQLELFEFIHSSDQPELVRSLEDIEAKVDWEKEVKDRTTGILIQGDQHEIQLSAIAKQHLRAGYKYRWRVIAIGLDGNIIATSPLRSISVPK